jgi:ribulose-phosphate 3-epimerase
VAVICPTVTADEAEYGRQLGRIQNFASRIHLDFMDGIFAPLKSISLDDVWWQPGPVVDLHVMYQNPIENLETIVRLQPHLVIVHAESDNIGEFLSSIKGLGIKRGLAILQETSVESIKKFLPDLDHVLIFSGKLGHFGGNVDLSLLQKITELKSLQPSLEIGWDGGINNSNVDALVEGGVDVLNVGGYIQKATEPEDAYDTLKAALREGGQIAK